MNETEWVTLARVLRPQGRKGEVLADLLTDTPQQFDERPQVSLESASGNRTECAVESWWLPTGRSAGRIVLKLRGIDTISSAEEVVGASVQIPVDQRLALADGTYYVSELVGCQMRDGDLVIGTVSDMLFPQDPTGRRIDEAASLFVVKRHTGEEILVPFANAFVKRIDVAARTIEMDLPAGLLELNG